MKVQQFRLSIHGEREQEDRQAVAMQRESQVVVVGRSIKRYSKPSEMTRFDRVLMNYVDEFANLVLLDMSYVDV